uniref:Doublecortin domain-containing protein n=1 Tax=Meloidogyne hapla TaxID=6305 RepID=A0A1I8BPQ7_MELHA
KQIKKSEKRFTQKSLPSVVASKALAVAENRRAKTVFFYRDGDEYFTGVRVPINKGRFRTMDALMDSLNESIPMPFGVRRLHTPNGKTPIRSLDELQPHGRYIAASSTRRVQGVDLEAIERRKRHREDAQRRWNFQTSPSTTNGSSANTLQMIQINPKSATSEINVSPL